MLTTLTSGGLSFGHNWPDVLPNGKGVLFTFSAATGAGSRIGVVSLETGAVTELVSGGSYARYVPTGHIVYGVDGTLRAVSFDQDRLTITGSPVPVVEVLTKQLGAAVFAIAGSGSLVYLKAAIGSGARRELIWVERDGREKHVGFAGRYSKLAATVARRRTRCVSQCERRVGDRSGSWHAESRDPHWRCRVRFVASRRATGAVFALARGENAPVFTVRRRHRHSRATVRRSLGGPLTGRLDV